MSGQEMGKIECKDSRGMLNVENNWQGKGTRSPEEMSERKNGGRRTGNSRGINSCIIGVAK